MSGAAWSAQGMEKKIIDNAAIDGARQK